MKIELKKVTESLSPWDATWHYMKEKRENPLLLSYINRCMGGHRVFP